jgi:hypothetical protein
MALTGAPLAASGVQVQRILGSIFLPACRAAGWRRAVAVHPSQAAGKFDRPRHIGQVSRFQSAPGNLSALPFIRTLSVLFGAALWLSACATPPPTSLPRLAEGTAKESSQGLVPQEYFCTGKPAEAADPVLAREIQSFLEENGMLAGMPPGVSTDLPVILNGPVKGYVRVFTTSHKGIFEAYLCRSGRYLPMMRRIFQEQGLPQDLVYLCLVESGFSPWAKSPAEAVGPWQFISGTAQRYGLKVNNWVDERRDPEKSTRAAARYLRDLFRQFGSWYLAAAGYNAGEKRVEGVVQRHATRDFWTMAGNRLLPQETCNYVPQLIAATLIAKNPQHFGFREICYQTPLRYERVEVPAGIDLPRFAQVLGVDYQTLKELNPELNQPQAPPGQEKYALRVPAGKKRAALRLAKICLEMEQAGAGDLR